MEGFLGLGFLIGMRHALEADHLAAVGTLIVGTRNTKKNLALRGAVWGLGHTITLFAICAAVILLGLNLTDQVAAAFEFGVGAMLVVLGVDVLRRMRARRVHFHVHTHDNGRPHLHAHGHAGAKTPHGRDPHDHRHASGFPVRALVIGLMHGAAGSAGLLALAVAATREPWTAVGYVVVFGIGSILGMTLLTLVAAWPLGAAERHAKWIHNGLSLASAALAFGLGIDVMAETAGTAWGIF